MTILFIELFLLMLLSEKRGGVRWACYASFWAIYGLLIVNVDDAAKREMSIIIGMAVNAPIVVKSIITGVSRIGPMMVTTIFLKKSARNVEKELLAENMFLLARCFWEGRYQSPNDLKLTSVR